jgi:5-dehydro-2-deoxygluconokinase
MGGNDVVGHIMRWPHEQVIKVLAYCHRNDPAELWADQLDALERLDHACSLTEHEYLIELQPSPGAAYEGSDLPDLLGKLYRHGLRPAWWKLPPSTDEHVWVAAADVLREHDDSCRGILILGQGSSPEVILNAFRACAPEPLCRGFAVGRSLFIDEAIAWFSNEIEDLAAVDAISSNFEQLASAWEQLRGGVISVG